jgi:uncharacterized damage-inducible protein DinB
MTYYGTKELAESFRTVRKNTVIIAEEIPEDKYGFQPSPDVRTVAQTLAHLAISPRWQLEGAKVKTFVGMDFASLFKAMAAEEEKPRSKAEMVELLKTEGEILTTWIDGLSEEFLAERVEMPFGSKTRFEMLLGTKEHEMHHRAQLMVVERMIGIVPHLTRQMQERMAQMTKSTAAS